MTAIPLSCFLLVGVSRAAASVAPATDPHSIVGTKYAGDAPPGFTVDATAAFEENGKVLDYGLNIGSFGAKKVLWVDKVVERNAKGRVSRLEVIDAVDAPTPPPHHFYAQNCEWLVGESPREKRAGGIALIDDSRTDGQWHAVKAWTIDTKTGKIKKLDPAIVSCAPEGD